jgi:hypothetical protein
MTISRTKLSLMTLSILTLRILTLEQRSKKGIQYTAE